MKIYCCEVIYLFIYFQAIVLCFRLHFTKDNITNNTAAATVRQVVTVVFERVVAEDERYKGRHTFFLCLFVLACFDRHQMFIFFR